MSLLGRRYKFHGADVAVSSVRWTGYKIERRRGSINASQTINIGQFVLACSNRIERTKKVIRIRMGAEMMASGV